jgi:CRISPR/Cas system-associated exonuclease Cas4 (RecB family)
MAGLHCERRLWLLVNRPGDRREPTLAEQRRMDFGIEFGREVTRLFPGGVEITPDYRHPQEALDATTSLIEGDAPAVFEAAFLHHDVLIRADILKRSEANPGAWDLIEVKSASNGESGRKPKLKKHISDMAVQLYVLEGAGITVRSISLAWVNSNYERMGELDWNQLIAIENHSEEVRARAVGIDDEVDNCLKLIDQPAMPRAVYGKTKCGECEFNQVCWADEPQDSIIYLPRISSKKLDELSALGVERIPDIPNDFELTKTQAPVLEAYSYPDGELADREQLEQWIEKLVYPLYFFDCEAWNPFVPPFDNTWPYMQIPFQYSLHIQDAPGLEPRHREFLATAECDPRPDLIEQLVDDLGTTGSIVVHHAEFETERIRELAAHSPAHSDVLRGMLGRIVDTEIPFKRYWYLHPGLKGRSTIKVVLPTLVPDLSYEGMEIADGLAAAFSFEDLYEGAVVGDAAEIVRKNLIDYCRLEPAACGSSQTGTWMPTCWSRNATTRFGRWRTPCRSSARA